MRRARLASLATNNTLTISPGGLAAAVDGQRMLTDRDRHIISLLADHQVLTTDQIARLAFTNVITAQHRLSLLTGRAILARFRRCQRPGTQAWRYTLGINGALIHAASSGQPLPRPATVTEKVLSLAESPKLSHLLGTNEFFVRLHQGLADTGWSLAEWWPEKRVSSTLNGVARPDAYGEVASDSGSVGFFLEYDNGTETIARVVEKLDGYADLAKADIVKPILFVVPGDVREHNLRDRLTRHTAGLPVATASLDRITERSPLEPVWRCAGVSRPLSLPELARLPAGRTAPARRSADHQRPGSTYRREIA
ncbi:hypothetical protein D5S17_04090 [Pseudonocardiaceae bacterium YIM PH 21723]|nr:hypothetical protein D5S17_04090 [Pseudonocardiaceae bacterium YIM PH 21723]